MESLTATHSGRKYWLLFSVGLACLFLTALLCGLRGITPAHADPSTLYVDRITGGDSGTCGTVDSPCRTISHTLNTRASDGDTILIASGTYTENLTITGITLTLRGGYTVSGTQWLTGTGETVIHGNNADRTITIQGSNSLLEYLTITGGQTPAGQCWGGGMWVSNGDVTTRSSLITNNVADCSGGGIEVNGDLGLAHLTLENSVVAHNLSRFRGGGIAVGDASATLINTQVVSNTADDGTNGFGGGIGVYERSRLAIVDSVIGSNYALLHGGGVEVMDSTLGMTNTLVVSNTAANINVLAIGNSAVTIQNSTITDNNPQGAQAILAFDPPTSTLTIRNNIMWNNALNIQWDGPTSTLTVTYSDIQGGWVGTGNIDADPLLVGGGDYRLQKDSPCIDAGTNTGAPDHDLDQQPRPHDGDGDGTATADMGAYEFRLYRICLPLTLRNFRP